MDDRDCDNLSYAKLTKAYTPDQMPALLLALYESGFTEKRFLRLISLIERHPVSGPDCVVAEVAIQRASLS
jgi:hypothetical protein